MFPLWFFICLAASVLLVTVLVLIAILPIGISVTREEVHNTPKRHRPTKHRSTYFPIPYTYDLEDYDDDEL